jgi:hypothetical protein
METFDEKMQWTKMKFAPKQKRRTQQQLYLHCFCEFHTLPLFIFSSGSLLHPAQYLLS